MGSRNPDLRITRTERGLSSDPPARLAGAPLEALVAGRELSDPGGALSRAYRLGPHSAVLVRPDGVVAWRHDRPCADHAATLSAAVATALRITAPTAVAV